MQRRRTGWGEASLSSMAPQSLPGEIDGETVDLVFAGVLWHKLFAVRRHAAACHIEFRANQGTCDLMDNLTAFGFGRQIVQGDDSRPGITRERDEEPQRQARQLRGG